jgi:multiple sugar transport system permease protein
MQKKAVKVRTLIFLIVAVLLTLAFYLLPIYWVFTTAIKKPTDAFVLPPKWIFRPTLENFDYVLRRTDFLALAKNSIIVATGSMLLAILLSLPASYALARFRIKNKNNTAFMILTLKMFPPIAVVLPFFIMYRALGLYDTVFGLILLYTAFNIPLAVWLLIGFIREVPKSVEESALIDGASFGQIFRLILLPLISVGLMATGILCFIMSWNEFLFALILTGKNQTLPVFIYSFINFREIKWGQLMTAAVIMSTPILVSSLFIRRYLIRGLTFGAVKE